MVGDHCQLGPVVMCKQAAKAGHTFLALLRDLRHVNKASNTKSEVEYLERNAVFLLNIIENYNCQRKSLNDI